MKKLSVLLALLLLCQINNSQEIVTYKKNVKPAMIPSVISKTNSGLPIYIQDNNVFKTAFAYPVINNEVAFKKLSYKGYSGDSYYNKGNMLYGVYSYDEKNDVCGIALGTCNLEENKPVFSFKRISQYDGKSVKVKSCMSGNGKLLGIYSTIVDNKNRANNIHLMVIDFKGNIVWQNSMTTDFKGDSYYIDDIAVSNEGELSVLLNSKSKDKKDKVSNQELLLVLANDEGVEKAIINLPNHNVTSAKSLLKSDGNYFVCAYAESATLGDFEGCIYTTYNSEENEFDDIHQESFGDVVNRDQVINRKMIPKMLYLMERLDGSVTALGDLQSVSFVTVNKNSFYMLYGGDIYINHFGANGEYAFNTIQKQQIFQVNDYRKGLNENGVSFKACQNPQGEIFILYNDNPKNEFDNFVAKMQALITTKNIGRISLVKIDDNNEMSGRSLFPDRDLFMKNMMDINNGNIYSVINYKKYELCKTALFDTEDDNMLSTNQLEEEEEEYEE